MELSLQERLILYNQYEILKELKPENCDIYNKYMEILSNGYSYNYNQLPQYFFDEVKVVVCEEVHAILNMFWHLSHSYRHLSDKNNVDENKLKFNGFVSDSEEEYSRYANFVLNVENKYKSIMKSERNTMISTLTQYRAMFNKYKKYNTYADLTAKQIVEIISVVE